MAEASTNLGRVSLVPRGEYDPETQYERLDIVRYSGSSYLALHDMQGVVPEDGTDYMLIAEKGDLGPQGPAGETGPQGIQGEKGDTGDPGMTGPKGDTGEQGPKGDPGETGPAGPKGDAGETGAGIQSIERTSGTGAAGTTDTYTITMTDGSTSTFQVYNGADGTGAGDMTKSVYDPQGKNTDVFAYVDEAVKDVKIDVDEEPAEGSENPVSSGGTFAALRTKQPTLTGLPGQVVGFDASGAAEAVSAWGNPNLLDNWYFPDPINQRGKDEYTGSGYTIDRWRMWVTGITCTLTDDGIVLTNSNEQSSSFVSYFDADFLAQLNGKTITISALTSTGKLSTGTGSAGNVIMGNNADGTFFIQTWKSGTGLAVAVTLGSGKTTSPIIAAKLELGPTQTLARQDADGNWVLNDPPPNKALELAKCQRYLLPVSYYIRSRAVRVATNLMYFVVPTPTSLRAMPTLIDTNNVLNVLTLNGARQDGFSISVVGLGPSPQGVTISAIKQNHGLTDAVLECSSNTSFALLSSEL